MKVKYKLTLLNDLFMFTFEIFW